MFRKPVFWIVFIALSGVCAAAAYHYFPKAFPQVAVDLRMDRQSALSKAEELAQRNEWGPEYPRKAASYSLNSRVQHFIELEAGGVEAFREVIEGDLYSPYTWRVRLFQEQEVNEVEVRFTPQGEPYGFHEKLPEDEPGPAIPSDSARVIAEQAALEFMEVDLENYELVETSEELQPGERLDHSFVYERKDEQIGDAEYRLRLGVSGDKLTELHHFVRVPEAFDRRYSEMRSANSTLGMFAMIAAAVLFFGGGCVFGLFYLQRRREVIWKMPAMWGTGVAFLMMLTSFNQWPLLWMNYDTAVATQSFVLQQVMMILIGFIGMALIFSLIFMAAESLSRKAFPHHVQFWRIWSGKVAPSPYVLGITAGAFLLTGVEILYVTGAYFFSSNVMDWWVPSSALFDPDIVAQYFPWLTAVAAPLQAAFWEESLFRAIPIAGAVLIGRRYGGTLYWVIAAFALQALIFGAAHADYPQQPFYARSIELIIPSIVFGLLFYFFGLLPAILLHFWYNMVWFSMPLFAADVPGIFVDKILIVLIGLIPFWIILFQWWRHRSFSEVPESELNQSWEPDPEPEEVAEEPERRITPELSPFYWKAGAVAGIAGVILWILFSDFRMHSPPVDINRAEAVQVAYDELERRGIELSDDWQPLSDVHSSLGTSGRFIWQEGGEEAFSTLMGHYLNPPRWHVRFVDFSRDVEERAEQYHVFITGTDSIYRFRHNLPEHRPGEELPEERAMNKADSTLQVVYDLNPDELELISAESSSLPERTDWSITYADTLFYTMEDGQARITINIAGDQVVDTRRFVHIPEQWSRDYQERQTVSSIFQSVSGFIIILLVIAGLITAIVRWTKGRFSVPAFLSFGGLVALITIIDFFNGWQEMISGFSTAQPYLNQLLINIGGSFFGLIFVSGAVGLIAGLVHRWQAPVSREPNLRISLFALFPALLITGLAALASGLSTTSDPAWGDFGPADAGIPILAVVLNSLQDFIFVSLLFLTIFTFMNTLTDRWSRNTRLYGTLLFLLGFPLVGVYEVSGVTSFLIAGAAVGAAMLLLYSLLIRAHLPLVILMAAILAILGEVVNLVSPAWPGAVAGFFLSVLVVAAVAWYWHGKFCGVRKIH